MSTGYERRDGCFPEVELPEKELFLRLGTREITEEIRECIRLVKEHAVYRYCYVRVPLLFHSHHAFTLGDVRITSRALGKNLQDCKECFVMTVTLGAGVDRLIGRMGVTSPARQFFTDAAASALVEGLCDRVFALLSEQEKCKMRFSPGYGDFLLEYQPDMLQLTEAGKRMGLYVTDTMFLTPSKSVTAIVGIEK